MIQHLALIMDGNRRWAKKYNLAPWIGHNQGVKTVKRLIEFCLEHTIAIVSIYTFALENFKRSPEEISHLFSLIIEESEAALPDLLNYKIKVKFCGDSSYFPETIKPAIEAIEKATSKGDKLLLNILFCYGGRQEIISATKRIASDVKSGFLQPEEITQDIFEHYLLTPGQANPDLIIRTGGFKRLSDFLLYQAAYSELYFTDRLWPDLTKEDLTHALEDYKERRRNFGR